MGVEESGRIVDAMGMERILSRVEGGGERSRKKGLRRCRMVVLAMAMAAQGRRQRLRSGGGGARVASATGSTATEFAGLRQGEAAAAHNRSVAAAAVEKVAVGLLSRSPLSSYLRGSSLFFFSLQMTARVCGGVPSPLIDPIMGREGKGPT